jgi:L-malate glycosyltransferase
MAKKIGIYNEPSGGAAGGSEFLVAVLAEALSVKHQVEIVHHRANLDAITLANMSGTNLSGVATRYVPPEHYSVDWSKPLWQRYRKARLWQSELSRSYDVFISALHGLPPFCHAPNGVLLVLFPIYRKPIPFGRDERIFNLRSLKTPFANLYNAWEWKQRMGTYQSKLAISLFSRDWTQKRWDIECNVVYPPAVSDFSTYPKENLILSVGRFTVAPDGNLSRYGHQKKQLEKIIAFKELQDAGLKGWRYFTVGGLADSQEHRVLFESLNKTAAGYDIHLIPNIASRQLKELYGKAKIFWHASGYGIDEAVQPELVEHFGMSTAEAMAAGCVPVVINRGGQKEIVEHGVTGFLWNTVEELKHYTQVLMRDDQLRLQMSKAAMKSAQRFTRKEFISRFLEFV